MKDPLADSVSDFCYPEAHSELVLKISSPRYFKAGEGETRETRDKRSETRETREMREMRGGR